MKGETILFKMRKRKRKGKSFKKPRVTGVTKHKWLDTLYKLTPPPCAWLFPIPLWLSSDSFVVVFICFVLGFLLFGAFKTGSHSPGWLWTCCYLAQEGQELLLLLSLLPKYHRTRLSDYFLNVTAIFRFFLLSIKWTDTLTLSSHITNQNWL